MAVRTKLFISEDERDKPQNPDYSPNRLEYAAFAAQQEKNRLVAHNALVDAKMAPEETRFYIH